MQHYLLHLREDTKKELLSKFPACSPGEWAIMDEYDNPAEFYDSREAALAQLFIYKIWEKYEEFGDATCSELGVGKEIIREAILGYILTPDEKQRLTG